MSYVILYGEHESVVTDDALTANAIRDALMRVQTTGNVSPSVASILGIGDWVGPAPRITREAILVASGRRIVRVAWLYQMPDPPEDVSSDLRQQFISDQRSRLLSQSAANLNQVSSGWSHIRLLDYDPVTNGSIPWWQCTAGTDPNQCASSTVTRDTFELNQQFGASSTIENPVGPTPPPAQRPRDLSLNPEGLTSMLKTVAVIGALGVGLYFAWPYLQGVRRRSAARANPRRNRRRTRAYA